MPLECPCCHRVDMVQKVTAIVLGETSTAFGSSSAITQESSSANQDYYVGSERVAQSTSRGTSLATSSGSVSTTQSSQLANQLTRPPKPRVPSPPSDLPYEGVYARDKTWQLMALKLSPLVLVVLLTVGILLPSIWIEPTLIIFAVLLAALWFLIVTSIEERVKRERSDYEEQMVKYLEESSLYETHHLPRWQRASAQWERLFYCRRCDMVYIPDEDQAVSPAEMSRLLYT